MRPAVKRIMAALLLASAAFGASQARAGLILDLTAPGQPFPCGANPDCGSTTFGWAFAVTSPITVDGIGVWDSNISGPFSSEAGLFTSSGTPLASATITTGVSTPVASADPNGHWLFEHFAPITLPVGGYLVGNVFTPHEPLAETLTGFVTIPQVTLLVGTMGPANAGFAAPTSPFFMPIFGPTLETVPESATWVMLILGVAMTGFAARRRSGGMALAA